MKYILAEACQNTFLLVDLLHETVLHPAKAEQIHQKLIAANRDDAMILIHGRQHGQSYDFEMMVLGVDKQFGAFCGNGARACAAYVFKYYPQFQRFFIRAPDLNHELFQYENELYSVQFPKINFTPTLYFQGDSVQLDGAYFKYQLHEHTLYYADALEPHLILKEDMDHKDLQLLAQKINQDKDSFPFGINVTSYKMKNTNHLYAKTYERGVQAITQSCGTGATCAAAFHLNGSEGVMNVENPGGQLTIIHHNNRFELKGHAMAFPL